MFFPTDPKLLERLEKLESLSNELKRTTTELSSTGSTLRTSFTDSIKSLTEQIENLKIELAKRTSDYEADAKQSSEKAATYLQYVQATNSQFEEVKKEIELKKSEIQTHSDKVHELVEQIETIVKSINVSEATYSDTFNNLQTRAAELADKFNIIQEITDELPEIEEKLSTIDQVINRVNENDSKGSALYKAITDRKKEIDDLYYKIIGYVEKDDDDNDVVVSGLKQELESAYSTLKSKLDASTIELAEIVKRTEGRYDTFIEEREKTLQADIETWNTKLGTLETKITELLPRALTAGLSYAYSEKKDAEIIDAGKFAKTFTNAIIGLVLISLIPFTIGTIQLCQDVELYEVISRMPKMVLSILPLYIPVLWVAYSANRRINLSKRLIEEYSHKEVLSKTFEGLSRQIENIEDGSISADLRVKLLYNILEVNSENPGKLISDYNKSDHPVMDALEKSAKLSDAMEKLARIPGMTKMAQSIGRKSEAIMKEQSIKVEAAIETVESRTKN